MTPLKGEWHGFMTSMGHRTFTCGHCGVTTGTKHGTLCTPGGGGSVPAVLYVCGGCNRVNLFEGDRQVPAPKLGKAVAALPPGGVSELYDELRAAAGAGAFTAAVTIARTLIAQVAVNKGAPLKQSFLQHVEWLEKNGYTTAPMKPWVDHIRDQANVSAHELKLMDQVEAGRSVSFAQMLLQIVYEFPAAVPPP